MQWDGEIMKGYCLFCSEVHGFMPYIWLEARLANPFECKMLILSNDLEGHVSEPIRVYCARPKHATKTTDKEIMEFAKRVFHKYKEVHGKII